MRSFPSIRLDTEEYERVRYIRNLLDDGEPEILHLYPPKGNGGIKEVQNLFRIPFYTYEEENTFFKRYNMSDVCGFEIWYEDGDIKFYWYVPNKQQEDRYRRHLHQHYSSGELGNSMAKFPTVNEGDYFAGTEYHLKHHYFEPVNHHESKNSFSNIYEDLLSEINTKDSSRVIIQVLYKPAENDWTELHSMTVDDLADRLTVDTKQTTKWFGLKKTERPLTSAEKEVPQRIREQKDEKGYYVNFRIGVFTDNPEEAEREMSEIDDIINLTFESGSGQNFVPGRCSDDQLPSLLEDMVARRPRNMRQPKMPLDYLKHRTSNAYKHIIMTATELASIAHIPNSSEVDMDGIRWSLINADGTLPPGASDFVEPTEEEQEEILRDLMNGSEVVTDNPQLEGSSDDDDENE